MIDRSFPRFLRQSLDLLKQDVPAAYAAMVAALDGREVLVAVDGLAVTVFPTRHDGEARLALLSQPQQPVVEATTTSATLRDVLSGKYTLGESIYNDCIELRGELLDLLAFYDALVVYFGGAVRSPGFPALLDEFFSSERARQASSGLTQPEAQLPQDFRFL